jgi:branched-chain amino acid transport system permease protein
MSSQRAWTLLVCTLLVLLPFGLSDFWIFIAIEVLAFALYALSFNLLLGFGGMLSFGHAAFFGVGAYSAAIFFKRSGLDVVWMFTLAPLVAMAFSATAAAVIGYFSVRRSGIYFSMLTFAFQMLLYTVALKASGLTGGDDGITGLKPPGVLGQPLGYYFYALCWCLPSVYLLRRLVLSPFGLTLRALKDDPLRVQYVGVHVRRHQWAAFVISAGFAGLGGALFAFSSGNVFPSWLNWTASATPVVMAVLGGVQSFYGAIVGAAVYVVLEVMISGKTEYWPLAMGIIIVLLVLLMPTGLVGRFKRAER